jgi:signal transduction histidine kinase
VSIPRTDAGATSVGRSHEEVHPTVHHAVELLLLEERTKWAMHIHDGLTQSVTSAILELQTFRHRIEQDPVEAAETLRIIEDTIREDLRRIRAVLFELQEGQVQPEPAFATFVNGLVERWRLPARVSVEGDLSFVDPAVIEAAEGIVAEAITNAAKHSGAPDVAVRVRAGVGTITIEVEDRGRGIPLAAVQDPDQHFGLRMMKARAEEMGGTIEIGSTPGRGTNVVAVLPVGGRGEA